VLAVVFGVPATAQLTVRFVDPKATAGLQDGSNWQNAYLTIDAALDWFANNEPNNEDSHILVAEDIYSPAVVNLADPRDRSFLIPANLSEIKIHGGFLGLDAPAVPGPSTDWFDPDGQFFRTVLSGDAVPAAPPLPASGPCYHVVHLPQMGQPQNVTVDGVLVRGGRADDAVDPNGRRGGAVRIVGDGTIEFENTTFMNNWASPDAFGDGGEGGAVWIFKVDGGPSVPNSPVVRFDRCTFRNNHAVEGVGIHNQGLTPLFLANCIFFDNGQFVSGAEPILIGAPICLRGGAVYLGQETTCWASNTLMHSNRAQDAGGAIFWQPFPGISANSNYTSILRHCTLTANSIKSLAGGLPSTSGAGIHIALGGSAPPPATPFFIQMMQLRNCIVYDNVNGTPLTVLGNATVQPRGVRVEMDFSDVGPGLTFQDLIPAGVWQGIHSPLGMLINVAPQFSNPGARNYRLLATSPCVNTGSTGLRGIDFCDLNEDTFFTDPLNLDLDLNARLQGASVDMGAYDRANAQGN